MPSAPARAPKSPPLQASSNPQYDLFTSFFGDNRELSNTIELWDAIPKYAVSARRQNKLRDEKGRLTVQEQDFEYRPVHGKETIVCRLKLQPASIEVEPGVYQDFYPAQNEELIEEVIKKIFSDARYGHHLVRNTESWVRFTLNMVQKELRERGRARSLDEIKRSLDIMSRAVYTVEMLARGSGKGLVYTNPILTNVARVNRGDYLDDPKAMWCAQLPALISKSINDLSYRQFNYLLHMRLSSPLARWMHKRLVHRYRNASAIDAYHFTFSSVVRDSGLLNHPRTSANVKELKNALDELHDAAILMKVEIDIRRHGRKIEDIVYNVWSSPEFRNEVKAANARAKKNRHALVDDKQTNHSLPQR